jgi:hypothetical protein
MKTRTILFLLLTISLNIFSQDIERKRPKEWEGLVYGGRFMDRFAPIPTIGKLKSDVWGTKEVTPRYVDNGIEHKDWSYWGGNIKKDEKGIYHQYVCRWREDSEKGHMAWPQSEVAHVTSKNLLGPYTYVETIGKGHNPEIYQISEKRFVLYVNHGYYISSSLNGPWEYDKFTYDQRNRAVFDHITNNTFAQREDGSYIMIGRGGEVCLSQSGLPPFLQVNEKTVYPPYDGRYEDPVIWRTNIQYHLIVNDWLGRIAYYLRSKDGIHWKTEAGEAYQPGITVYEDKTEEDWYKYERIKMFQDKYGRAIQANFAVADTIKRQDKGSDNHSSKNIGIPLIKGKLLTVLNTEKINPSTEFIEVKIEAEEGFNPHKDISKKSLRFGASEEVNYGRGAKIYKTKKSGKDLILIFKGKGNGFTDSNFAGKLLGKTKKGKLLFGYSKLPGISYIEQSLSTRLPILSLNAKQLKTEIEVQNFGQIISMSSTIKISYLKDGKWIEFIKGKIPALKSFEKKILTFYGRKFENRETPVKIKVTIEQKNQIDTLLEATIVIR